MAWKPDAVDRLRRTKVRLSAAGAPASALVPFVEVCEFWLSHGPGEVLVRARMRLGLGRGRGGLRPAYVVPKDRGGPLPPLVIPPAGTPVSVSIVIPVLNNAFLTHHCIRSIVERTAPGTYEVIVVDNGSDARTRDMLAKVSGLTCIANDTNKGFVEACNQGVAAARGEFVIFLNNDTVVFEGWTEALLGTFESHERVGAVGARLIYPDGRLQEAGSIIWSDGDGWNYGRLGDPEDPAFNYVREVDYCSAACLAVPRALLEAMGGFDMRYQPAYYEDVDLCFRLRERGYRVLYQPESRVVHLEGATAGTDVATGLKQYQRTNRATFMARHAEALARQCAHDPALVERARDRRGGLRVLVVDHLVPRWDEDAGSVRMAALLRMLTELGHRVTFLPDNLARSEPYTGVLQQQGVEVLYGPPALDFVPRRGGEFDVAILCRAGFASKYVGALRALAEPPFIIFDTVDLHYLRERRRAELAGDVGLNRSAERTREIETGVMRQSDMVWLTSTYEAEFLAASEPELPPLAVVPMIHDVRAEVPPFEGREHLLFIGGFNHPPNEDAVLFFAGEMLPLVRRELPGVELLVVGGNAPRRIQSLDGQGVRVLGHVPDVQPIFDRCRLSVAPLRYGAGVKGKVTQSLAWGLPVVATPVAAEGLGLVDGEHLAVASDPAEFARRVVEVYRDAALWNRLSLGGRRHVDQHLGYEAVKRKLMPLLEHAVRHNRRTEAAAVV